MTNVSFDRFRDIHPEYMEIWRNDYMCSVYLESSTTTMVEQHGFYLDEETPEQIEALFKLGDPITIYCGDQELIDQFTLAFPQYSNKVVPHGWYESSIYAVVHIDRILVKKEK